MVFPLCLCVPARNIGRRQLLTRPLRNQANKQTRCVDQVEPVSVDLRAPSPRDPGTVISQSQEGPGPLDSVM